MIPFAELVATTNFSFLRGGSHPEELVATAARLGLAGLAVADRNTLAGVVRGHVMARENGLAGAGFRYAVGCRLAFRDGTPDIVAWPTDRAAYGRLCRLLTLGNRRAPKGECHIDRADLLAGGDGLILGVVPPREGAAAATSSGPAAAPAPSLGRLLGTLREAFPRSVRLLASFAYAGDDHRHLDRLARVAREARVPLLATNDVLYHAPERRPLQDVLTCIREKTTLAAAGRRLAANAERHLKDPAEMARLFRDHREALAESAAVLSRLSFSLDELRYQYPDEPTGDAASPREALARLVAAGARQRYPGGVPPEVTASLAHELAIIRQLEYEPYFLTVHDIVRFARQRGILAQGRGSAANSAVCYVLGVTEVDPVRGGLLFERFISAERGEPPDIDVDFEHERREEVMQYIYGKYGRHRAGLAATVITYRTRSAVREVGKVFGLSEDTVDTLSGTIWGWSSAGVREADIRRVGLDPEERTMQKVMALSQELIGFPRHLSQHVGGFVMTRDRLDEMVPVMNAAMADRTTVEWDKDDLDALRMLKVDVLALGMLSCIRRAFDFMTRHYGDTPTTIAGIPAEDEAVYRMLSRADSLGVFQVESRAQMTMLPRLRPQTFYDLVIEVAIVRPGPIQGDMVHPYLRRRQGIETVTYPSPAPGKGERDELEQVLGKTLGVPLFQEQAMKIAIVAAGFTPGEADRLRRAMATFKRVGTIKTFQDKMVGGMVARGYARDFAERCFRQIEGFGEYGFPESHAASFALLVYASAWIKCHYPDVFCAALLNAQPLGFYAPSQIVRDAERHGVAVRPPDVNLSDWDSTLEGEGEARRTPPPERGRPGGGRAAGDASPTLAPQRDGLPRREETPTLLREKTPTRLGKETPTRLGKETPTLTLPLPGGGDAPPPAASAREETTQAETRPTPAPERGRSGGGQFQGAKRGQETNGAASRFDHTPAKTERARTLRRNATWAERLVWSKLRSAAVEGESFRRQHPVGPYVLDFFCPSLGLVVELDGDSHGHAGQIAADRRRDAWLRTRGLTVLRFWNTEVRENLEGVLETIRLAVLAAKEAPPLHKETPTLLREKTPTLSLPLPGGGEAPPLHPTHADMAGDIRSTHAVRLGLRQIKGFREDDAKALMAARGRGYDSVRDLWLRSGLSRAAIERLADADAFRSLGLDRRDALWAARALGGEGETRLPLFDTAALADIRREPDVALPPMPVGEHVVNDYRYLSLSLKAHPLSFLRTRLAAARVVPNGALRTTPNGRRVTVAGLVLIRQRPGTAKGVIFMTIEDETDIANIIVWPKTFERFRPVVLGARLVSVTGKMQSESGVIHVVADRIEDRTAMLAALSDDAGDLSSLARADEVSRPTTDMREKIGPASRLVKLAREEPQVAADLARLSGAGKVMPRGRNFH